MNGYLQGWFIPCLIVLCLIAPPVSFAAGSWAEMYPPSTLAQQKSRLESRVGQLYSLLRPYLSAPERSALANLVLEFPLGDPNRDPFAFYAHRIDNQLIVTMSVESLLWLEDLCTAYAWLHTNGYSLETIDEYVTMLRQKRAADFPGGRYPPPRTALRVPSDALRDPAVSELSLRLRNSTYAFILTHELGHIVLGHRGYAGISMAEARMHEADADRFALDVLLRVSEIPVGAVLFFQAQAYMMPNPGLFKAEGKTMQAWEAAVLGEMTHPLTADRLQALALGLDRAASREPRGAERETLQFVATRLANIAEVLQDVDLQQCMAVAAQRADPAELAPRRPGNAAGFLKKCTKQR